MSKLPRSLARVRLVVFWGLLGALLGVCLLWLLLIAAPEQAPRLAAEWIRMATLPLESVVPGWSVAGNMSTVMLVLHGVFGLGGALGGALFRLIGLWRQHDD